MAKQNTATTQKKTGTAQARAGKGNKPKTGRKPQRQKYLDKKPPAKKSGKLTVRQEKFVQEYALCGNATAAAVNAGYSERTAAAQGSRLLETPKIKAALEKVQQSAQEEFGVTREELYKKYDQAFRLGAITENPSAMVSAVSGMAKLFGFDKPSTVENDFNFTVITGVPAADDYTAEGEDD